MSRAVTSAAALAAWAALAGCQSINPLNPRPHVDVAEPTSVLPLPAKVLLEVAPSVARAAVNEFAAKPGIAVTPAARPPDLSIELVLFWVALTFSTICTVIVSPIRRARWSSNSGRYWLAWKIDPLLGGGAAATGAGRTAVVGWVMSTGGRALRISQPARASADTSKATRCMPRLKSARGAATSRRRS